VEKRTIPAFALAGAAAGLAHATKASAATLLLPLGLAPFLVFFPARRFLSLAGALAAAGLAFAAAFLLGQPSALAASRELLAAVAEQGAMVRSAGSVPYTNQYAGTPHGLYELKEIVLWGLGPALGIAALLGAAVRLRAVARGRETRELLLCAWAVPFFLLTASFEVRFPRYLLPLYPVLLLAAAHLLSRRDGERPGRRLARRWTLGLSGAYLLAFLSVYARPHSVRTASEWFHENVAPGATVLLPDWEEGFPFSLSDRPADRFRFGTLSLYAPDAPEKTEALARALASGDLLVFPTKRLYGAVTQASERFPDTDRLFRLLFSGDLGWTLARTFSSPPQLLGLSLPTERADESFSVYDHPKVVVFRNVARLDATELARRLREAEPSRDLSRTDLLLARPADPHADSGERIGGTRSTPLALLLWAALLQALGLAAWRLLGPRLPAVPGVYALSKVVGVVFFGLLAWALVAWGLFSFVPSFAFAVAVGVILLGVFPGRLARALPRREALLTEAAVWGTFLFFAAVRMWSPEIYWGEKPMDFAILNSLLRSELLPPPEPWFAGTTLSYTYFGHFLVAAFAKALGIHPALAFNLGVATAAALTAAALFAAGAFLGGRLRAGGLAVLLGLFAGNLAGLVELSRQRAVDFDLFWSVSRVLKGQNEINEFPFWSFLFADLHAHVLAFPLFAGFLAVLLLLARQRTSPDLYVPPFGRSILLALSSLFLAALAITNGWSLPSAALLLGLLLAASGFAATPRPEPPLPAKRLGRLLAGVVVPAGAIALPALLVTLPFWRSFEPPPRHLGWERGPGYDALSLGLVHGLALALLVPFLLVLFHRTRRDPARPRRAGLLAGGLAALFALSLVDLPALLAGRLAPAPSVRAFLAGLALLAFALAFGRGLTARERTAPALAATAFLVLLACEVVFLWDRMNTVFKLGLDATLLLAVAGAAALDGLLVRPAAPGPGRAARAALAAVAGVAALATSALALAGHLSTRRVETPRGTLDGLAYRAAYRPAEAAAFAWIEQNVPGLPTIVEAWGPPYRDTGRFASNTGLPTLAGWDYHLVQRGKARAAIDRRIGDVFRLYEPLSLRDPGDVLARHGAVFVVSGAEEREAHGEAHAAIFRALPGLLSPVFREGDVTVWRALAGPPVLPSTRTP
jgi:YYY domain-containing protein